MSPTTAMTVIERSSVEDFTYIPNIIDHAFNKTLRCEPADHPVLVTEPAWNTPANRERMAEILFEEFKVPAFYIANSGVLTAFVHPHRHSTLG
jgi:actin-like protein 6B